MGMGGVFTDSNSAKVFGSREDYNTKRYSVLGCTVVLVVHHSFGLYRG